jgi:hypothetical protein
MGAQGPTADAHRRNDREEIMNVQRRDFLLLATLATLAAAAAAMPALGQTAAPAAGPAGSAAHSAASIPDFSGIWAHPYLTGFEPPASGPGPVFRPALGGWTDLICTENTQWYSGQESAVPHADKPDF